MSMCAEHRRHHIRNHIDLAQVLQLQAEDMGAAAGARYPWLLRLDYFPSRFHHRTGISAHMNDVQVTEFFRATHQKVCHGLGVLVYI